MNTANIIIKTSNLCLRSITLDFKDDIYEEFTSEITTYMFPRPASRIEETVEFIEDSIRKNEEGANLQAVILNKANDEFLGCAGLHHIDRKNPELGIWIKKSAHGHGYGKEAIIALKKWADNNLDYEHILYPVDAENIASRKIPEYLGGKVVKEYDEINMSNKKLHILEYRLYPQKLL